MNEPLKEISRTVEPNAHAVLIRDGAGRHVAHDLIGPDTSTRLTLPACAPDLNPVENVWPFLRDTCQGDRIFTACDHIVDRCCTAGKRLVDQPWTIMAIRLRQWAHRS